MKLTSDQEAAMKPLENESKNMKYNRVTCFVPALAFACDVPQLREKVSSLPEGVTLDEDGVSEPECANVSGGEVSMWYEVAK